MQLLLKLHGSESERLIHQYQLERMSMATQDCAMGSIAVRAVFVNDTLTLDILNCRNLKAVDSGGSADPYVKVQLMPVDKFPDAVVYKSKVHKNTLFPLFDETFSRWLSPISAFISAFICAGALFGILGDISHHSVNPNEQRWAISSQFLRFSHRTVM